MFVVSARVFDSALVLWLTVSREYIYLKHPICFYFFLGKTVCLGEGFDDSGKCLSFPIQTHRCTLTSAHRQTIFLRKITLAN